jgi:hypothetical protein
VELVTIDNNLRQSKRFSFLSFFFSGLLLMGDFVSCKDAGQQLEDSGL